MANATGPSKLNRSTFIFLAQVITIGIVYFFSAEAGHLIAKLSKSASAIWPATSIGLALIAYLGWKLWPGIWLGVFAASVVSNLPIVTILALSFGLTLEAICGAWLLQVMRSRKAQFDFQSDTIAIGTTALITPLIGASLGTAALVNSGLAPYISFSRTWFSWWSGSALGILVILPIFLSLLQIDWKKWQWPQRYTGHLLVIILFTALLSFLLLSGHTSGPSFSIFIFTSLLIASYFFTTLGLRVLVLIISIALIVASLNGLGPFVGDSFHENLVHLQLFLAALALTANFLDGFRRADYFWLPAFALILGWALTGGLFYSSVTIEEDRNNEHFASLVQDATDGITNQVARYEEHLRTGVAFYRGSNLIDQDEWRNFVDSLNVINTYGEYGGIGIILFKNKDQKTHYFVPYSPQAAKIQVAIDSDPILRASADLAYETNSMAMTKSLNISSGDQAYDGFVLFYPIFRLTSSPLPLDTQNSKEQNKNFAGWIYSPVLISEFFTGISGRFWSEIEFFVFDSNFPTVENLIYRSDNIDHPIPNFEDLTKIRIAQQDLTIGWKRSPGFIKSQSYSKAWICFAGAIFSLVVSAMLVSFRETNRRALRIASEKTALLTEREKALQQIREQYDLAIKGSNDGIWDWNTVTNEVYFSPRWKSMIGYSESELSNTFATWDAILHPDDRDRAHKTIASYLERKSPVYRLEHRLRHKDGSYRWILARGVALWREDGSPYRMAGSHTDITEVKRSEVRLIEARESALAGARSKSEFLANMSHEIRTPLSGIVGLTSLLDDTSPTKEQREYTQTIRQSAESLLAIINDILDFSKIEAGKLTLDIIQFSLETELTRIANLMRFSVEQKDLKLQIELDPELHPFYWGDPTRIRQILVNLISNAIKFSSKGLIKVSVNVVRTSEMASTLKFSVQDEGIGIPKDMHRAIFSPFSQADPSTSREFGGTGLGLSICKTLVRLMNGKIGIESELGKGSLFWFELTLNHSGKVLPPNATDVIEMNFTPLSVKVLLAEDNEVNLRVATAMLNKFGIEVVTASNGLEALEAIERQRFDLILMDCQMPEIDGYAATRKIREHRDLQIREVPIIAITANALAGDRERCLQAGMNDYLAKPVKPHELYSILGKWIESPNERTPAVHPPTEEEPIRREIVNQMTIRTLASLTRPGEPDVLLRVVGVFLRYYPSHLTGIQEAMNAKDWPEVTREAHGLKAAAGGVGLEIVTHLAQKIEDASTYEPSTVKSLIPRLEVALNEADVELRKILGGSES